MTWLNIHAQDVWLFRDGKPFTGGEDHDAHSMFPPTPITVQGALRQKISVSLGVSLPQYRAASARKPPTKESAKAVEYIGLNGSLEQVGEFRMRGPFLSVEDEQGVVPLLVVPADMLFNKKTHHWRLTGLTHKLTSDMDGDFLFPSVFEDYENVSGHWMTAKAFLDYLDGEVPLENSDGTSSIWKASDLYDREGRTGVSTNAFTSYREEGQLYQVQFVRPKEDVGLLVHVDDAIPADLLEGRLTIGGEAHQAYATVHQDVTMPTLPKTVSGKFKVVLLTPAYLDNGWKLGDDWSALFEGQNVTLRGAILHRPLKIGGWHTAKNRARTMHNYVAPGSVYYFQSDGEITLPSAFTQNPAEIAASALGFGQYAIGQWTEQ